MNNLIKLRKKANKTQEEMAKMLNVNRTTYGKWEIGTHMPDADTLVKLSSHFGVSADYLLDISNDPTLPNKKERPTQKERDALESINMLADIGLIDLEKDLFPQINAIIKFLEPNKDIILMLNEKTE